MNNPHCELPDHSVPTEHFSPRGDSSQTHAGGSPTAEELTSCLFFSPDDGRIWLNDQRMLLLHIIVWHPAPRDHRAAGPGAGTRDVHPCRVSVWRA